MLNLFTFHASYDIIVIRRSDVDMQSKLDLYKNYCRQGKTRKEIAELMNVTIRTVQNYLKKTGIYPKDDRRMPNLNEDYFSVIDNEEKAYLLGFLFADGYLETNERTLTLNVSEKDVDILHKLKVALDCGNEVRKSSTKNCVRLYMSSMKLVSDVKKLGLKRGKSHTIRFPDIEEHLYRHFLRGYFDGDGHVGVRQCALVIGSDLFYKDFCDFMRQKFNKKLYVHKKTNYYRVQFNRGDHEIINWLYEDSNIYLDRKYKSYLKYWHTYTERIRGRG